MRSDRLGLPRRFCLQASRVRALLGCAVAILFCLWLIAIRAQADEPKQAEIPASPAAAEPTPLPNGQQRLSLPVKVVDTSGKPAAGVWVKPWALNCSAGHSAWSANDRSIGFDAVPVTTDDDGLATISYPLLRDVSEKIHTNAVSLQVDHLDLAYQDKLHIDVPLEQAGPYEIKLKPAASVEIRPVFDDPTIDLKDVFLIWSDGRYWARRDFPTATAEGTLKIPPLPIGKNSVLAVRLDGERATHFSKVVEFDLVAGEPKRLDVSLQPCSPIHGVLSDNVPRPVHRGRIKVESLQPAAPGDYDRVRWYSWVPIEPDGSFVIQGWPIDERIQLTALCDGYIAATGATPSGLSNPSPHERNAFRYAQVFAADSSDPLVVEMKPLAKCLVTVVDDLERPIQGINVVSWPNVSWWHGGSQVYCDSLFRTERMLRRQVVFDQAVEDDFPYPFGEKTDAQGKVTLGLPDGRQFLSAASDDYRMPINMGSREIRFNVTADQPIEVTLRLEPTGREPLGDWDKLAGVVFGCGTRDGKRLLANPFFNAMTDAFVYQYKKAQEQHAPKLLSESYEILADAFLLNGDFNEFSKWHGKALEQAAKAAPK